MKTYVLYHANCYDGFGAAWAAHHEFGDDAEYIPVSYGSEPPELEPGSRVYIVDFSYPAETLQLLNTEHHGVVVIDHHKTAQDALKNVPFAIFDMDRSGAVMTWQYFFEDDIEAVPTLLLYIQDRDLWRFKLPHSKEVSAALRSYEMDFEVWDELSEDLEHLMDEGAAILRFQTKQVAMMCRQAYTKEIAGYEVLVANATCFWSEVANELLEQHPGAPFAAAWHRLDNGLRKWSLRSRSDFDCSEVALQYGGGGHPQAAGFVTP